MFNHNQTPTNRFTELQRYCFRRPDNFSASECRSLIEADKDLVELKAIYAERDQLYFFVSFPETKNVFLQALFELASPIFSPHNEFYKKFESCLNTLSIQSEGPLSEKFLNQLIEFAQDESVKAALAEKRDEIYHYNPHTLNNDFKNFMTRGNPNFFTPIRITHTDISTPKMEFNNGREGNLSSLKK